MVIPAQRSAGQYVTLVLPLKGTFVFKSPPFVSLSLSCCPVTSPYDSFKIVEMNYYSRPPVIYEVILPELGVSQLFLVCLE